MPEDVAQAAQTSSAQAAQTPQTATDPNAQAAQGKSTEDYERMIRELRDENAKHRLTNKDLQEFKVRAEQATLTEQQKAEQRAAEAERRANEAGQRVIRTEMKLAAARAGLINPDLASRLIDSDKIALDENGEPTNLDTLVSDLIKANPYLVGVSILARPEERAQPRSIGP